MLQVLPERPKAYYFVSCLDNAIHDDSRYDGDLEPKRKICICSYIHRAHHFRDIPEMLVFNQKGGPKGGYITN
jgi:hypothetical protein